MLWEDVLRDRQYYYYNPVVRYNHLTVDCVPCDYQTAFKRANNLRHIINSIDVRRGGYDGYKAKNNIIIYKGEKNG
jgi:hypothetical protein